MNGLSESPTTVSPFLGLLLLLYLQSYGRYATWKTGSGQLPTLLQNKDPSTKYYGIAGFKARNRYLEHNVINAKL